MEFKDFKLPSELGGVTVPAIGNRNAPEFYRHAVEQAPTQTWAEFGVNQGGSTRKLLKLLTKEGELHLFDSLCGLPEPWFLNGPDKRPDPKGCYNSRGHKACASDDRVEWHVGWFSDVLPVPFREQLGLVHLDADLYSSTRDALTGIREFIGPGTVLIFDELIQWGSRKVNTNWREGEWKALAEQDFDVQWLANDGACAMSGVVV